MGISDGMTTTISPLDEERALEDMDEMDRELTELVQSAVEYDWEYYTNISDEASDNAVCLCLEL